MSEETVVAANTEEQPYQYNDIYEAPSHLRVIRSARISLPQINALVLDAYNHKLHPEEGVRDTVVPDFGGAKNRFQETHTIEKGFWVEKTEKTEEK